MSITEIVLLVRIKNHGGNYYKAIGFNPDASKKDFIDIDTKSKLYRKYKNKGYKVIYI